MGVPTRGVPHILSDISDTSNQLTYHVTNTRVYCLVQVSLFVVILNFSVSSTAVCVFHKLREKSSLSGPF